MQPWPGLGERPDREPDAALVMVRTPCGQILDFMPGFHRPRRVSWILWL
jgi:hypothetical protein